MRPGSTAAFFDELEKIAWFGTYYHGTSPANESSILREGLKASHGGGAAGATQGLVNAMGGAGAAAAPMQEAAKGAVHVSPSKLVAKMYGAFQTPEVAQGLGKALRPLVDPAAMGEGASWRQLVAPAKQWARAALDHQPLQVNGKGLNFVKDPFDRGGLRHMGDIAADRITKAAPSRIGNLLRKLV